MEWHPCFIVSETLKNALEKSKFTGFEIADMEVTKDPYFDNNYQLKKLLPKFYWLKVMGKKDNDDIYLDKRLMLSEPILNWLKDNFNVKNLSEDNSFVDDFMKRFLESQKNK